MDAQIEQWRVIQFANMVYNLSQQNGSKIARNYPVDTFVGKSKMYDRLGLATALTKTGRNENTPNETIAHSRRMLVTQTRHWGTLVDDKDKVAQIHNLESEYMQAALKALGRLMDDVFIQQALGTAAYGEDGSSAQTLGNAQKVMSVASSVQAVPNLQMLRKMKLIFDKAEVEGKRYIYHSADFLDGLLSSTTITSADYNTVKALVKGELNTFMGFEFVQTERLAAVTATDYDADTATFLATTGVHDADGTLSIDANSGLCLAVCEGGMQTGRNPIMKSRISERDDKCYSAQIYAAQDWGAVRMEEAKIIQGVYLAA